MFTEPEANNCFSIIFRDEYKEPQNNGVKHKKQTPLFVCIHVCSWSFNNKLACTRFSCQSIYSSRSAEKLAKH